MEAVKTEFELRRVQATSPATAEEVGLETLYFGGGTPSLLPPDLVAQLIQFFTAEMGFAPAQPEVTLEANPDDVTASTVAAWLRAGVTRVSLGVQSLRPEVLEWMHRPHGPSDGLEAIRILRRAGMPSVSVDVIFGLPPQLHADPVADMRQLLDLEPDHVSAYGLTVETRTPLARWVERGSVQIPGDAEYADQFLGLHTLLTSRGFEHYEVSNYARPNRRSRHNQAYWQGSPYLGLGPSAHSFTGSVRRWNTREWAAYDRLVGGGKDPLAGEERLTREEASLERLYLGLRTVEGVASPNGGSEGAIQRAVERGWLRIERGRVRATPEGWLRLDALVGALTTSAEGG